MKDCTIIINTCDAYADVWELFFCAFEEYWPNCKYSIILNTEEKKFIHNTVQTHNIVASHQPDMWGKRLKQTLEDILSQYVIMLYDDFILEGFVDQTQIEKCLEWLNDNPEIAVFYFINNPGNNIDDNRFDHFELLPQRADYKLNSAPAVWRRDKLLNYTEENDTPWAWEFFGSYRAYSKQDLFYCVKKEYETIYPYNYSMGGAIYRGKWVGKVVLPLIQRYRLNIDVAERGLADGLNQNNKRTLLWKIQFFILGFRMIGIGAFVYLYRIIKKKAGF